MKADSKWIELGWKHSLWNIIRLYTPLRGKRIIQKWETELREKKTLSLDASQSLNIPEELRGLFFEYMEEREQLFALACKNLRTEEEALEFCRYHGIEVGQTTTQSQDHYQSSKSMVATVSAIAKQICATKSIELNPNPQKRCVWHHEKELHVTARNLDGAIPSLVNPKVVWEIKEYWGKTKGGSKMSDALYECQLIGSELRDYEERTRQKIYHIVFLDGKEQWSTRKSDLKRFIDILNQGLIDYLIVGKEVQTDWSRILKLIL